MKKIFTAFMMMLCAVCVASAANYLTFTAEEDSSTFGIAYNYFEPDVQYSLNGGETWTELAVGDTILLAKKGDKAHIRGYNEGGLSDGKADVHFVMTGAIAASGSVMSLIDGSGSSTEIPCSYCFIELFSGCTGLTKAPELPATTLDRGCYAGMFQDCTSLTQAPELPATSLSNYCYNSMFRGCTSLTQAPELPAMTLANSCYSSMFSGCTSLTQAPELPATEMTFYCYNRMFSGCTSLTKAPELPATTLAEYCYNSMFSGCTSLTQAPELPATEMTFYCYSGMFLGCTSLTQAPELPAKEFLGKYSYSGMFSGCTSLSEINVSFDDWDKLDATFEWVADVAPTGTFICPKTLALEYGISRIPEGWTVKYIEDMANYLTFTAEEDGSTFGIINEGGNNPDVQYSLDGGKTWTALVGGDTVVLAHKGDKALLRGDNPQGFSKKGSYSSFKMTGKVAASGSVMSLIDGVGVSKEIPNGLCFNSLFGDCASLMQAPELPATTLTDYCYYGMFSGCTSLTQAPALPATTLAESCYSFMFKGCTSLTKAPALPVSTLAIGCYLRMFKGCTSLTQAPELPATNLAPSCYYEMFFGCTNLIETPKLPATTLAVRCYEGMFGSCTSLTQAPELPATTLADDCYAGMFESCTSLTQAPELPATTLAENCYNGIFARCTSLSQIRVSFDEWSDDFTGEWTEYVAPTGTFICPKDLPLEYGWARIPEGWTVKYIDDTVAVEANYLTFTAEEDGSSFGIVNNGGNTPDLQYSLDGGETWNALTEGEMVALAHKGDKALLKGNNPQGFSKDYDHYSAFKMIGKVAASGSVMSLIDSTGLSTKIPKSYCFLYLFKDCTSLTQAPELPATTLVESCYVEMFSGCTSLTQAPELPATTLADGCYYGMFSDCTSLTQAPELPVTSLSFYCYAGMFSGCTSLTQAPELPATTLAEGCYATMFWNCTSLTRAPELPAMTLAVDCYRNMFQGCTSLTQAPELPATTLADNCYFGMFKGCASLTQAPELPATTLNRGCYSEMFISCTSLSEIKVSFDDWKDEDYTLEWVVDVAPTGTFICPKTLALEYGVSWIPEGWTVKYIEDVSVESATLADNITVWTDDLTIFVCGAEGEVSLYDMSGRIVATSNSKDEERALCVPSKGVYVVRTNNGTSVVLVR